MAWPRATFKDRGEFARLHKSVKCRRVNILVVRGKNTVDVKTMKDISILLQVARVTGKILAGTKLRGIDEEGHYHGVALLFGAANKALVPGVQCPHRRNQSQRPAARA